MLSIKRIVSILIGILFVTFVNAQNYARISIEEPTYDFGTISETDGSVHHTFLVKNTGSGPLVITRVTASCGCTKPEYSKEPIMPGMSAELKVTFDPKGRPGPFHKTIQLYSNGQNGANILALRGYVKPKPKQVKPLFSYPYSIGDLKVHTKNVLFSAIRSEETLSERVNIMNDTQEIIYIQLGKLPNYLELKTHTLSLLPGESSEIDIIMDAYIARRKGRVSAELPVTVSYPGKSDVSGTIYIAGNIIDDFSKLSSSQKAQAPVAKLSGTLIEFGQLPDKGNAIPLIGTSLSSGKVTGTFDITNTGKSALKIYSVTCDDDRIEISGGKKELKPEATATFKVSVRSKDVKARMEALINVVCNDPNGPIRLIKVTAYK